VLCLPLGTLYYVAASRGDYTLAAENIFKRALFDRVMYKGESHRGFIYFGLKDGKIMKSIAKLQVVIKNPTTEQSNVLMFDLDLSGEEVKHERRTPGE
jgi:hypothetical protein